MVELREAANRGDFKANRGLAPPSEDRCSPPMTGGLAVIRQLDQPQRLSGLIFLRKRLVVHRLQIAMGFARETLLALRKNLRRSRILPKCMDTA